jgi:hypothetical protein
MDAASVSTKKRFRLRFLPALRRAERKWRKKVMRVEGETFV